MTETPAHFRRVIGRLRGVRSHSYRWGEFSQSFKNQENRQWNCLSEDDWWWRI